MNPSNARWIEIGTLAKGNMIQMKQSGMHSQPSLTTRNCVTMLRSRATHTEVGSTKKIHPHHVWSLITTYLILSYLKLLNSLSDYLTYDFLPHICLNIYQVPGESQQEDHVSPVSSAISVVLSGMVFLLSSWLFIGIAQAQTKSNHYGLQYDLSLEPEENLAMVSLTLSEGATKNIWSLRLRFDPQRHREFEANGKLEVDGEYITWSPPDKGGKLSFQLLVDAQRTNGQFDARMTNDWALFRGDDLFPVVQTDQLDEAEADASLHVHLPHGWTFATAYPEIEKNVYQVEQVHRSFDRPTGWMAAGRLGVRREKIAGIQVSVAGPMDQGVRRMDILAMLNWNLPKLRRVVPNMPKRLLIVSARDQMWRGGLSGPSSLYLHADRPLISENATSTLLHELMHVVTRLKAEKGADWIVEGIAEYYSLKIMWRSGTITERHYQKAFQKLEKWARQIDRLDVNRASGGVTAKAVGVLRKLDHEIHEKTKRDKSLDDVVELLTTTRKKVSLDKLRAAVEKVMSKRPEALTDKQLGFNTKNP